MISKELKKYRKNKKKYERIDLILRKSRVVAVYTAERYSQIPTHLGIWICLATCNLIIKK